MMSSFEDTKRQLTYGDFHTRIGWNNKKLAIKNVKPHDENSPIGLYELGKWKTDWKPSKDDLKAKDWIMISDREAECGDACF